MMREKNKPRALEWPGKPISTTESTKDSCNEESGEYFHNDYEIIEVSSSLVEIDKTIQIWINERIAQDQSNSKMKGDLPPLVKLMIVHSETLRMYNKGIYSDAAKNLNRCIENYWKEELFNRSDFK